MVSEDTAAHGGSGVLVTGGTGFVATWIIIELLSRGHQVRTTVRDLGKADALRRAIAAHADTGDLSFAQADLLSDVGWSKAVEDVEYVVHVASPLPMGEFRKQDLVRPARDGMRHVLTAASQAGVKRTVLTSSTAAAQPDRDGVVADEAMWAKPSGKPVDRYARSKVLAEQDAWAFAQRPDVSMELVSILPASVMGPIPGEIYARRSSADVIRMMLDGTMRAIPNFGWNFVDVRDLADLHIRAMTTPAATGNRFLASGEFLWFREVAALLRAKLGDQAAKVSTRALPDIVVRIAALFNPEAAQIGAGLNRRTQFDSSKAYEMLGWRTRPAQDSILDAAHSLIEYQVI